MPDLPAGLAEPLHILAPWWQRPWVWLLLALTVALLFLLLRRRRQAALTPEPAAAAPVPAATGVAGAIGALRQRYGPDADLRPGLHELAAVLRQHFAASLPAAERRPGRTSLELARRLGGGPAGRLLRRLAELQFGRRVPTWDDFTEICDLALETVSGRGRRGRRGWRRRGEKRP